LDLDDLFVDCYFETPGVNHTEPEAAPSNPLAPAATVAVTEDRKRSAQQASLDTMLADTKPGADDDDVDEDGKDLTEKQKLERRERNREHAKRSRLRKKFLLESLQKQIHGIMEQMDLLKDALKEQAPDKADAIIDSIFGSKEQYTALPMPSGFGPVKTLMEPDFRLMSALSGSHQNFAISDPNLPDNPIVYVSQGFLDLTGYTLDQVLGRNCRFLQGPGTDQSAVDVIRKGLNEGLDVSVCLLNYKADGTTFWNQFFVAALRDEEDNVVNYVGVQCVGYPPKNDS
jgi:PAS domain S-box-containing protein